MRWIGYVAGVALVGLGFAGLVMDSDPIGWAWWFGGVLVAHDAILAPAVLLAGLVLGRTGRWAKAAAVVAGTVTLATLPTVLALGRRADNPSILPLDYLRNLLLVLAALGLAALVPRLRAGTGLLGLLLGLLAGLVAGLLVACLMTVVGVIDARQWALFLAHSALLGTVLGGAFGARLDRLAGALVRGMIAGLIAWGVWTLTLLPILLGNAPSWTITPGDLRSLVGEILLGGLTGTLLSVMLNRVPGRTSAVLDRARPDRMG
ncbi:hypothetical protein [Nonomuraea insulae]|uniref:Uncharacterized protein n=1 Tax=Nonomuraea insulae TaxID=1616787 RepID=A0ABW1D1T4_9ACTN